MIFAYNKEQVGDVLLVILEDTKDVKRSVERKGKVARVTADETGKTLAWNIFEASSLIDIEGNGQVFLSDQDVAVLNEELAKEGFEERLENTQGPVFVVGQIEEMVHKEKRAIIKQDIRRQKKERAKQAQREKREREAQ